MTAGHAATTGHATTTGPAVHALAAGAAIPALAAGAAMPALAADPAAADSAGLTVLATGAWPESDADVEPEPLPGFIASPFSALVAAAAERCLRRCYGEPPADPAGTARATAIILTSQLGDLIHARHVADAIDHGNRVSPLLFFQSVPNAVAGLIAARWGLRGPLSCLAGQRPPADAAGQRPPADAAGQRPPADAAGRGPGHGLVEAGGARLAAALIDDGDAEEALVIEAEVGFPGEPMRAFAVLLRPPPGAVSDPAA